MDERKRAIAETFGAAAVTYGRAGPDFFWPLGERLVGWAGVGARERVLDVAAGTGALGVAARERGAEVVAVDLAPEMVAVARANGLDARVMDAERLDFEDESFDRVLCGFAVFFLPDAARALAEWRRVLRPGGSVALSTFVRRDPRWSWMRELVPASAQPPGDDTFDESREGLKRLLRSAGFDDVRFVETTHDLRFTGADQWWAWLWSHGHRGVLERLSDQERARFRAAASVRIEAMTRIENTISARFTAAVAP